MQCNKAIFTKPYISVVVLSLFSPTDLSVSCACRYVCHFKFSFFFVSEKLSGSADPSALTRIFLTNFLDAEFR